MASWISVPAVAPLETLRSPPIFRGSLAHASQAPVSLTTFVKHLRIDSASVVTNPHGQVSAGVFKFEFDALRSGMTKAVDQSLLANAVNLILDR